MNPATALMVSTAAVHLVVAVFHSVLWRRARGEGFGTFAAVSVSQALYNVGGAGMLEAGSRHVAAHFQQIRMVGAALLALTFVRTLHDVMRMPRGKLWWSSHLFALLYLVAGVSMAGIDPGRPAWPEGSVMAFGIRPDFAYYPRWGVAVASLHGSVAILTLAKVARRHWHVLEGRILVLAGAPALLGWSHDMLLHHVPFRSFFLMEYVSVLTSIGIALVMQRRFVQATEALRERTLALRALQNELRAMQDELLRTEQLAALGELAGLVSQGLRGPIRRMVEDARSLHALAWERDAQRRLPLLGRMGEAIRQLDRLVKDLVAYARPVEPQYRMIELDALLGAAAEEVGAELGWEPPMRLSGPSGLHVHGDPRLLQRALRGAMLQVLHEARRSPVLQVRLREAAEDELPDQPAVGIEVRAEAGREGESGAPAPALRLVVVERLIEAHGGRVRRGRGDGLTWVDITLPVNRRDSRMP